MRKYQSYKSSGVEWIGDIPMNWNVTKIKYTKNDTKDSFIDGDWIESKDLCDEGIRYITSGNIGEGKYKEQGKGYISEDTFNKLNCTEIFEGDLIISRLFLPVGRSCILPNLNNRVVTCVDNVVLRPKELFNKFYLNYQFNSNRYSEFTELISRGVTLTRISRGMLGNNSIVVPLLREQNQIVQFLDEKTELIEKLISTKERKLTLLKEQRTSLINQVVTKGLSPNVKMKDSGVEWIGEIPEHWVIKKTKHIRSGDKFSLVDGPFGSNLKSEHYIDNGDVYIIESGFVTSGEFKFVREFKTISKEHFETIKRSECFEGCIIMSKIGEYYGMSGILPKLDKLTVVSGNCISIKISKNHNTKFIHKVLLQHWKNGTFKKEVQQTGQPFISMTMVDNISFPIPPLDEQNNIVEYLDTKTKEIDDLVLLEQNKIDLLKEYRQSLISEVVTGKIKVTTDE
jgi:type I restriction enzyme S subunit